MKLKHNDCLNFSTIDATKGICRITKQLINIDSETCSNLALMPKCKNCINFEKPDEKGIGTCIGLEKEDWTFESLNAITCKGHKFK